VDSERSARSDSLSRAVVLAAVPSEVGDHPWILRSDSPAVSS